MTQTAILLLMLLFENDETHYFIPSQLFNLNDTKENQTNSDNSQWNDAEAKFVARLAQAVCAELSSEAMKSYTDRPRTCGIITFYQKQRSTICLELQKLGIKVVDDPSNRWSKNNGHKDGYHTPSQAVSVKTVDGFQVSQRCRKRIANLSPILKLPSWTIT